jgi:hypothetical protein
LHLRWFSYVSEILRVFLLLTYFCTLYAASRDHQSGHKTSYAVDSCSTPKRRVEAMNPRQETSPELGSCRSITLIIHGVGKSTNDRLLTAAAKGYEALGIGGNWTRSTLSECPALSGRGGAEGLMIEGKDGCDFVVALPWSDRRVRMSAVAQASAVALLILTIVAAISFLARGPLDTVLDWLRTWSHRILAYLAITVVGWLVHVAGPNSDREFRPPTSLLWLPIIFEVILLVFSEPIWLWMLICVPVLALWLMSTTVLVRGIRVASTLRWRVALWVLLIAISFPTATLIRAVKKSADRAEAASFPAIEIPPSMLYSQRLASGNDVFGNSATRRNSLDSASDDESEPSLNKKSEPKKAVKQKKMATARKSIKPGPPVDLRDDLFSQVESTLSDAQIKALLSTKPKVSDLVTTREFNGALTVSGLGIALALLATMFNWLLDFGFDVLYFAGNKRQRLSLIEATAKTIRWFHDQAPNGRIIVVGHSLGSVLAAHTISSLPASEPCLQHSTLVTLGSPLNYLSRAFPDSVQSARQLSSVICPRIPWVNVWRDRDVIGKALEIGDENTVQYCAAKGGHADYWSDGAIWKAVAREALTHDDVKGQSSRAREACIFERHLGTLVFTATTLLYFLGAGLWIVTR